MQLQALHKTRVSAIQRCVEESSEAVKELRKEREGSPDNREVVKQLRKDQVKLRLMQSELTVEEAIRDRSLKVSRQQI